MIDQRCQYSHVSWLLRRIVIRVPLLVDVCSLYLHLCYISKYINNLEGEPPGRGPGCNAEPNCCSVETENNKVLDPIPPKRQPNKM